MDVPPQTGVAPDHRPFSRTDDPRPAEPTTAELAARLEAVEAGLTLLGRRIERLAVSLEASFESAVATEVHAAAAELRHTVSELGRILVRDLGKLPQMLTQHRQAIVAELSGPAPPSAPAAPAAPDAPDSVVPDVADVADGADVLGTGGDAPAGSVGDGHDEDGAGDKSWRGHLRRHRQA